jgi:hypothetical protein
MTPPGRGPYPRHNQPVGRLTGRTDRSGRFQCAKSRGVQLPTRPSFMFQPAPARNHTAFAPIDGS